MAFDPVEIVKSLLRNNGDQPFISDLEIQEEIHAANRQVQRKHSNQFELLIQCDYAFTQREQIFSGELDAAVYEHITEFYRVEFLKGGFGRLPLDIISWNEVRYLQASEGIAASNKRPRVCGLRKYRRHGEEADTGVPYGGGYWLIAIYPQSTGVLQIHCHVQPWDILYSGWQDRFMIIPYLYEAAIMAAATLAPRVGMSREEIDTILASNPNLMNSPWAMAKNNQLPGAHTVRVVRQGPE